ncbi:hypothetical protein Cgig2_003786 [Carnegiea gigantea]|uniref:Expansin-like CBD domain-containing protein n=1 Tax=Carnegiea gigantea TaxID=171969 RepID=A0A9Q1JPC6_9CARY|nr:hypothetical protein Cgig2_003786 [Carnegiea gigantea]
MLVHDPGNSQNILVSGVYGPTKAREKDLFWEHLNRMNSVIDLPWMIVGDLNELELLTDKQGDTPPSLQRMERLASFLSTTRAESIIVRAGACGCGSFALKLYGGRTHTAAALHFTTMAVDVMPAFRFFPFLAYELDKNSITLQNQVANILLIRHIRIRVPCVYQDQNFAFHVEKFSKFPNYLAIKVLHQGGQTEIGTAEVAQVDSPTWISMKHNYGVVWDTEKAPTGPLQFRFAIYSGFDAQYFYTEQVLPELEVRGHI